MFFLIFSILNVLTYSIQLTRFLVKTHSLHSNTYMSIFIHHQLNLKVLILNYKAL